MHLHAVQTKTPVFPLATGGTHTVKGAHRTHTNNPRLRSIYAQNRGTEAAYIKSQNYE